MKRSKNKQKLAYIEKFNKETYKMYQFRIKKTDVDIINFLDTQKRRNSYIIRLLKNSINNNVYSISEIKKIIQPIMARKGINKVSLFGSYARGEANELSDIDIYCERGHITSPQDEIYFREELEKALKKPVDIIYSGDMILELYREQMFEELVTIIDNRIY